MKIKVIYWFVLLCHLIASDLFAKSLEDNIDVLSYHVYLEPNITEQAIKGHVRIRFQTHTQADKVVFDSGNLQVDTINGEGVQGFEQVNGKLIISLAACDSNKYELQIFYTGKPKRGVFFSSSTQQVYTAYFSWEWMICNASPGDRATLKLDLLVPDHFKCIASGILLDTIRREGNKMLYTWSQDYETPAYTYGFALGTFDEFSDYHHDVQLNYYAREHSPEEIKRIFRYTGDMMDFLEQKSGIPFPQASYAQLLIGDHYQEMSGFALLKNTYGALVLKDSTETNLISHELSHQWWGNMITCKNWNHFWLNEGLATYMSAAYNEHRFGQEKYQSDIRSYFDVYDKIKARGGDKPLVFTDWSSPSKDDRNLVYFKGAYVLHLLREELGDRLFWHGIQFYTSTYNGQSVTTRDFQSAMELATGRKLDIFFDEWIY